MTPDQWQRVSELYQAAVAYSPDERPAFLKRACGGDTTLAREVESLLTYDPGDHQTEPGGDLKRVEPDSTAASGLESFVDRRIGTYEIRSVLGKGAMGVVFRARDPRLGRDVAVKILPKAFSADTERLHRFEQEARAAAAFQHPNIVGIYDVGTHDGTPYIVMECVAGETLAALVGRGKLPVERALDIGVQVADALAAAHARGIVHRDLKPSNIMVTPDGRVKVVDFGLARTIVAEPPTSTATAEQPSFRTGTGRILGTPAYMAPEQLLGQPGDERSDIYALGVIMFELVTGAHPFAGRNFVSIALSVLTQGAPRVRALNPSVPEEVGRAIEQMMTKERLLRLAPATAVKTELVDLRRRPAASSQAPTIAPAASRRSRVLGKYWKWVLSAALVSAIAYATGSLRFRSSGISTTARPAIVVLPMTNLSGDPAKDYLGVGIADSLATSLAKLSSVAVISRDMVGDSLRNTADAAAIAKDLGADLLIQGSVQQSGNRVRVNTRLMRPDGTLAWADELEVPQADLFSLERRIADNVIRAIRVAATASERTELARAATTNAEAQEMYWRGITFLERNDRASTDLAIRSFEAAAEKDSQFAAAYAGLGRAYVRKNQDLNDPAAIAKAIEATSRALAIDPNQVEVRLSLSNVYQFTGRTGAAVEELRRVLAEQPANDEAHRRLGEILMSEGQSAEALEQFRAAVSARPQYWRNHNRLGTFLMQNGRTDEAIAAFQRTTELRPDKYEGYLALGTAYQIAGDNVRATQNLEKSIAINPSASAYSNLGTIRYAEGLLDEAAAAFQQAIALRPNWALYHRNLGDTYLKLHRETDARLEYAKAKNLTQDALRRNPSDATLMAQLAVYEAKLGEHEEAQRQIAAAVTVNPAGPDVLYRQAVVLALSGRSAEALASLSQAIRNGYSAPLAREDDDLQALRKVPEFQKLVGSPK